MNIRLSVGPLTIPHRDIRNPEIQLARTKQEIEISERIEIAKERSIGGDAQVILPRKHFRTAERILDRLSQSPAECDAEELVRAHVQELHGAVFHRIDETHAICELRSTRYQRFVEFRQLFR